MATKKITSKSLAREITDLFYSFDPYGMDEGGRELMWIDGDKSLNGNGYDYNLKEMKRLIENKDYHKDLTDELKYITESGDDKEKKKAKELLSKFTTYNAQKPTKLKATQLKMPKQTKLNKMSGSI